MSEPSAPDAARRGMSLPTKILIGLVVGAAAGVSLNLLHAPELGAQKSEAYVAVEWWADQVVKPFGDLFLRLLFMVVVPIVFCSLFLGVSGPGSVQEVGALGGRTLGFLVAAVLPDLGAIGVPDIGDVHVGHARALLLAILAVLAYLCASAALCARDELLGPGERA